MADIPDPVNGRPEWVPQHIEWWSGGANPNPQIVYRFREAGMADFAQLQRALHVSPRVLHKWITQNGYSVNVITRNRRTVVAALAARYGPDDSAVLRFHCGLPIAKWPAVIRQLTALVRHEVPEWRTTWKVDLAQHDTVRIARECGWSVERSDDEDGIAYLYCAPLVPSGPGKTGEGGRE